ncbi:MAG: ABC transporter ATP-binding protein [Pseudomonadota bacterium]
MSELPLLLNVIDLAKSYEDGLIKAVQGTSLVVSKAEIVAICGPSGCGKSTLLGLIGALDRPTSGKILVEGRDLEDLGPKHRFRAQTIGMVFQFHHLLPTMTLLENVETPLVALGTPKKARRERAMALLERVGLAHRAKFFPNRVSGGERQRAAVARAVIHRPRLLLADEPTGNLDSLTGDFIFKLLLAETRQTGAAAIIATHNSDLAARCDRRLIMKDGRIVDS